MLHSIIKITLTVIISVILLTSCHTSRKVKAEVLTESLIIPLSLCPLHKQNNAIKNKRKVFRILSIDGGGIRGIIPARILAEFEKRSRKPTNELFDLMVGNSTGGLIVLALNTPNESGQPKYQASDVIDLYKENSHKIFYTSIFRKIYTGFGLWGPKYDRSKYDTVLEEFFGETKMSQLIKPTGVISYNASYGFPHRWSREYARRTASRDFFVKDIAAATSAAPTYFAPKLLIDEHNNSEYQVDGGIFANNPQYAGIIMALELDNKLLHEDIILISLGTGSIKLAERPSKLGNAGIIGWVVKANLIDVMMNAGSDWADDQIGTTFTNSCRIQVGLDRKISSLDNASTANIQSLLRITEDYIDNNSELIDHIVQRLVNM